MEATLPTPATSPQLEPDRPYFSPALLLARHAAQRRRAAAMVATSDTILGFHFSPLTPASYSRMLLIESPFLWRQAGGAAAVRDYLWIHAPRFNADGLGRAAFLRSFEAAICPAWLRWCYAPARLRERFTAVYGIASEQIADLMKVAFADEPAPATPGTGRVVCATLEAQMIDLFAERYRWEPERTRNTPLRQLYQFIRCNDRSEYAPEEAAIMADDLRRENEAASAARATA